MTPEMVVIAICQEFGWTYYEYMEQPNWFLNLVQDKLVIDSKKVKKDIKKQKRNAHR